MPTFDDVEAGIGAGLFARALEHLDRDARDLRRIDPFRFDTIRAELLYHTGRVASASDLAINLLNSVSLPADLSARLNYVAAMTAFESARFDDSLDYIAQSLRIAESASDARLLATAQLGLLRLVADAHTAAVPLLSDARRAVARSGDPHLMIALRLHFARVEASRHSPQESKRHLVAARDLLQRLPNMWLDGRIHLGLSIVGTLTGDLHGAIEEAQLAIQCAARSGHSRTELAGLVNLSHALQFVGRWEDARRSIDDVLSKSGEDVEINVAALDSLANLLIGEGRLEAGGETLREIDRLLSTMPPALHSRWAESTLCQTKVRLLQASGAWKKADSELAAAITAAVGQRDIYWEGRFRLLKLKGLVALGKLEQAGDLLAKLELQPTTLDNFVQRNRIVGFAAIATARSENGLELVRRADRVSLASGNTNTPSPYLGEALAYSQGPRPPDHPAPPPPDLDTAVALIELGGHPHILAREAVAVVDAAGCARAVALIATGANGPRVIERRGWDEPAALAAARKPGPYDVLPLGDYRDEPWQLVVDPRPGLEHRCTLLAIRKLVGTALTLDRYRRDEQHRAALWPAEALDGDPEGIWASAQMSEILSAARRIAPTPLSILVTGETGTGKEMLARAIHRASDRADRPMLPFNCTAVPRDMIESQLFGYRKGAFTGADTSFAGVIRSAAGGTLFLDEIAEVPLEVQPKLLRFLETHEIHPLGEPQPIKVDVRVIAATNGRLEQLIAEGRFREDLFYRLNVVRLKLPPLRERREEIPPLVDHYLRKYGDEQKKGRLTLSDETLEYLLLYAWPGNLRQLANEVRRMVAMAEPDSTLTPGHLSPEIQTSRRTIPAIPTAEPEVRVRIDQPLPAAVQILEQTMVKSALDRTHGRVEEAARMLGISRKGLFLKRRRWGLHQTS